MKARTLSLTIVAAALAAYTMSLQAQTRRPPGAAAGVPVEIALQVGAKRYDAVGSGECRVAEQASIYGVMASQFAVSHDAGDDSLRLTLWQPKGAAEMVAMEVAIGRTRYRIDTVKAAAKKDTSGSARATLQKSARGATLTIDGAASGGEKIAGTIKCGGLMAVEAQGG